MQQFYDTIRGGAGSRPLSMGLHGDTRFVYEFLECFYSWCSN